MLITAVMGLFSTGGAFAQSETIGMTQTYSDAGFNAPAFTGTTDGNVSNSGEKHGVGCNYYTNGNGKSRNVYDATGKAISTLYVWNKTVKGTDYSDTQWVGYDLSIADGKSFSISGAHAQMFAETSITWKLQISKGATVLYNSENKTASNKKADELNLTFSADEQEKLKDLTGNISVRIYMYQNGSNKYFTLPYLTVTGTVGENTKTTYTVTTTATPAEGGSVVGGGTYTEGDNVVIQANPSTGYKLSALTVDGTQVTDNPYTITNISGNHTAEATFAVLPKVVYDKSDYIGKINSNKILNLSNATTDEVYPDADGNYTIPSYADKYFYREGYVFAGWSDGNGNIYKSGDQITGITSDVTLTPTWTATTQSLDKSNSATTVTWSFAYNDILFNSWQSANFGYYVQTANVNSENIAIPMQIVNGKVDNSGRQAQSNAQVNVGTTITIPAVKGMIISIPDANTAFSTTTIAGATNYEGNGTKSLTYTYDGDAQTIDIVIGESSQYLKSISVTYPSTVTSETATITSAGYATYVTKNNVDFSQTEGLTAYKAKYDATAQTITLTKITEAPAKTAVVLKGAAGDYTINVATTEPTEVADNDLQYSDEATTADGTQWILAKQGSSVGFAKATSGTSIAAGKAYLVIPATATAKSFIGFGDGSTTGINSISVDKAQTSDSAIYNLAGQRVSNSYKGIIIQNGHKFINK